MKNEVSVELDRRGAVVSAEIAQLRAEIEILKLGLHAHGGVRKPQALAERRAFSNQVKYAGDHAKFDDWRFGIEGFLEQVPSFTKLLQWVLKLCMKNKDAEITERDLAAFGQGEDTRSECVEIGDW